MKITKKHLALIEDIKKRMNIDLLPHLSKDWSHRRAYFSIETRNLKRNDVNLLLRYCNTQCNGDECLAIYI